MPEAGGLSRHHCRELDAEKLYDVAGGCSARGPRDWPPPCMPPSEGLWVCCRARRRRACGGQAGAYPRIENYFGASHRHQRREIRRRAPAPRPSSSAPKVAIPLEVKKLDCGGQASRSCRSALCWNSPIGAAVRPGEDRGDRLRRALPPGRRHPDTFRISKGRGCPAGRPMSRRNSAKVRRSRWSAAATRRGRRWCFSRQR